jgi:hypothetical protein
VIYVGNDGDVADGLAHRGTSPLFRTGCLVQAAWFKLWERAPARAEVKSPFRGSAGLGCVGRAVFGPDG